MKTINQSSTTVPQLPKRFWITWLLILFSIGLSNLAFSQATVVWEEGFEGADALTNWSVDGGTWEIGIPVSGPNSAHSGDRVAATVLSGNYPTNADTRIIRNESFVVPGASETPRLRFWHWYDTLSTLASGVVEIKEEDGDWIALSSSQYFHEGGGIWTRPSLDLSAYSGQTVQVAFRFVSSNDSRVDPGWYIDDVELVTGAVEFNIPEGFEGGLGDWYPERGTWQIGVPTSGPGSAFSGDNVAGTILDDNYGTNVDSRLASPPFVVPGASEAPRLRFWHWYDTLSTLASGVVEIKEEDGDWIALSSSQYFHEGGGIWTRPSLDLSAYSGQTVQIAFRFVSSNDSRVDPGWYIDDVELVTGAVEFNIPEGFEGGLGDWYPERGTWQIGVPTSGPGSAFSGDNVAGTILDDNYGTNVDSRLASPPFVVPGAGENPRLRFMHWYDTLSTLASGVVEIKEEGGDWIVLSSQYFHEGGGIWTRPSLDLSAYSGQTVQIAFRFVSSNDSRVDAGWYIDDVELVTGAVEFNIPEGFEGGLGDWYPERGTWQIGVPASGPGSAFSGDNVAATILDDNYGTNVDSRLASPPFVVPGAGENPRLRFWHWYDTLSTLASGIVEIKEEGGDWATILGPFINESQVWSNVFFDLSPFAGEEVQIAFRFVSSNDSRVDPGWYLDDVHIESDTLEKIEDKMVNEKTLLTFPVVAVGDNLVFSLSEGAPEGAGIDASTGGFSWTPTEVQGQGDYTITVRVHQAGNSLSPIDSDTFIVTVNEVNDPPVIESIDGIDDINIIVVNEEGNLAFTVNAIDPDRENIPFVGAIHIQNFEDSEGNLTLDPWTPVSVASDKNWEANEFGDRKFAQIFGFNADEASNDWLISPAFNFTSTNNEFLSFETAKQFDGPDLEVKVSTDYDGAGNPASATWTVLEPELSGGDEDVVASGDLDLSAFTDEENVYIAFHYTSTGTTNGQASVWQVGNIKVKATIQPAVQTLAFSLDEGAPEGASITAAGVFSWTPTEAQGPGIYEITVRVTDNGVNPNNLSASETISVTVNEVNQPPTLKSIGNKVVVEEELLTFSANATDSDLPENILTFSLDDNAVALGASINPNTGEFTWTSTKAQSPNVYPITITVTDNGMPTNGSASETIEVTVTSNGENTAPVANDVGIATMEDGDPVNTAFMGDDVDSDDDSTTLTYIILDNLGTGDGSVVNNNDGTFTFSPVNDFQDLAENEERTVTFTYTATDSHGEVSDPATVTVTITGRNDAPTVSDVNIPAMEDGDPVSEPFVGDDIDSDDAVNTVTYSVIDDLGAGEGSVVNNNDGTFTFSPGSVFQNLAEGEVRNVAFTYRATDSHDGESEVGTVTVVVTGKNDAPVANDVSLTVAPDGGPMDGSFDAGDIDSDDNPTTLVYMIVDDLGEDEGTVTNNNDGTFTFDPGNNFQDLENGQSGSVSFTYNASDSHDAESNTATVTITITGNTVALWSASPGLLDFGDVELNDAETAPSSLTVMLTNLSDEVQSIATIKTDFVAFETEDFQMDVVAGGSTFIEVLFNPAEVGVASGNLILETSSQNVTVSLVGAGTDVANRLLIESVVIDEVSTNEIIEIPIKLDGGVDLTLLSWNVEYGDQLEFVDFEKNDDRVLMDPTFSIDDGSVIITLSDLQGNIAINSGSGAIGRLVLRSLADIDFDVISVMIADEIQTVDTDLEPVDTVGANGEIVIGGCSTCVYNLDVDNDGQINFRDIVFFFRKLFGHPVLAPGVTLPEGESGETVVDRIDQLLTINCDGFAPFNVDMDGEVNFRDIVFTFRKLFGHPTLPENVTLPDGVTIEEVNVRIDCLINK